VIRYNIHNKRRKSLQIFTIALFYITKYEILFRDIYVSTSHCKMTELLERNRYAE